MNEQQRPKVSQRQEISHGIRSSPLPPPPPHQPSHPPPPPHQPSHPPPPHPPPPVQTPRPPHQQPNSSRKPPWAPGHPSRPRPDPPPPLPLSSIFSHTRPLLVSMNSSPAHTARPHNQQPGLQSQTAYTSKLPPKVSEFAPGIGKQDRKKLPEGLTNPPRSKTAHTREGNHRELAQEPSHTASVPPPPPPPGRHSATRQVVLIPSRHKPKARNHSKSGKKGGAVISGPVVTLAPPPAPEKTKLTIPGEEIVVQKNLPEFLSLELNRSSPPSVTDMTSHAGAAARSFSSKPSSAATTSRVPSDHEPAADFPRTPLTPRSHGNPVTSLAPEREIPTDVTAANASEKRREEPMAAQSARGLVHGEERNVHSTSSRLAKTGSREQESKLPPQSKPAEPPSLGNQKASFTSSQQGPIAVASGSDSTVSLFPSTQTTPLFLLTSHQSTTHPITTHPVTSHPVTSNTSASTITALTVSPHPSLPTAVIPVIPSSLLQSQGGTIPTATSAAISAITSTDNVFLMVNSAMQAVLHNTIAPKPQVFHTAIAPKPPSKQPQVHTTAGQADNATKTVKVSRKRKSSSKGDGSDSASKRKKTAPKKRAVDDRGSPSLPLSFVAEHMSTGSTGPSPLTPVSEELIQESMRKLLQETKRLEKLATPLLTSGNPPGSSLPTSSQDVGTGDPSTLQIKPVKPVSQPLHKHGSSSTVPQSDSTPTLTQPSLHPRQTPTLDQVPTSSPTSTPGSFSVTSSTVQLSGASGAAQGAGTSGKPGVPSAVQNDLTDGHPATQYRVPALKAIASPSLAHCTWNHCQRPVARPDMQLCREHRKIASNVQKVISAQKQGKPTKRSSSQQHQPSPKSLRETPASPKARKPPLLFGDLTGDPSWLSPSSQASTAATASSRPSSLPQSAVLASTTASVDSPSSSPGSTLLEISALNRREMQLQKSIIECQEQLLKLDQEIDQEKKEIQEKGAEKTELEEKMGKLRRDYEALLSQKWNVFSAYDQNKDGLASTQKGFSDEMNELSKREKEMLRSVIESRSRHTQLTERITSAEREIERKRTEHQQLQEKDGKVSVEYREVLSQKLHWTKKRLAPWSPGSSPSAVDDMSWVRVKVKTEPPASPSEVVPPSPLQGLLVTSQEKQPSSMEPREPATTIRKEEEEESLLQPAGGRPSGSGHSGVADRGPKSRTPSATEVHKLDTAVRAQPRDDIDPLNKVTGVTMATVQPQGKANGQSGALVPSQDVNATAEEGRQQPQCHAKESEKHQRTESTSKTSDVQARHRVTEDTSAMEVVVAEQTKDEFVDLTSSEPREKPGTREGDPASGLRQSDTGLHVGGISTEGVHTQGRGESSTNSSTRKFASHELCVLAMKVVGNELYTCSADKTTRAYDIQTGVVMKRFTSHQRSVTCMEFYSTPKYNFLLTGSSDKMVHMYNMKSGKLVKKYNFGMRVMSMCVLRDVVFIGLSSGTVVALNLKFEQMLGKHSCHSSGSSSISCFCLHNDRLLTAAFDMKVIVWDVQCALRANHNPTPPLHNPTPLFVKVHEISVFQNTVLCMKVNDNMLYCGSADDTLRIFNVETWELVHTITCHHGAVSAIDISGDLLITACFDKLVRCFDIKTWKLLQVYGGNSDMVFTLCTNKDMIYTGLRNGTVQTVLMNLPTYFLCQWEKCGLRFGIKEHLEEHLSDHLSSEQDGSHLCKWANCNTQIEQSSTSNHLKVHLSQVAPVDRVTERE